MNKPVDSALLTPTVGYWINNRKTEATSTRSGEVTNPAAAPRARDAKVFGPDAGQHQ